MEESTLGRREENKLRTRSALERAAARLFEEQGFGATTVRDIAAAAGVGERTFFRYFPSKEDLVLQEVRDLIPGLMRAVRERPAEESPLTALREAMATWLTETETTPTILISGPPKDESGNVENVRALESDLDDAITAAFVDRLEASGADRADGLTELRATVQARAGVAAIRGMFMALKNGWCDDATISPEPGRAPSVAELSDLLRVSFSMLES
jgi:AcrR family transcriptional regulator